MNTTYADNLIADALAVLETTGIRPTAKAVKATTSALMRGSLDLGKNAGDKNTRLLMRAVDCLTGEARDYDVKALVGLNERLYKGIAATAGKLRTAPAEYNGSGFTDPSLISGSLKRLLGKMNALSGSPECSREDFALSLTHYFAEIFLLYPFGEETLPTLCLYFAGFARSKGFCLEFRKTAVPIAEAALEAFITDEPKALYLRFVEITSYLTEEEEETVEEFEAIPLRRTLHRRETLTLKAVKKRVAKKPESERIKPSAAKKSAPRKAESERERVAPVRSVKVTPPAKKAADKRQKTTAKTIAKSALKDKPSKSENVKILARTATARLEKIEGESGAKLRKPPEGERAASSRKTPLTGAYGLKTTALSDIAAQSYAQPHLFATETAANSAQAESAAAYDDSAFTAAETFAQPQEKSSANGGQNTAQPQVATSQDGKQTKSIAPERSTENQTVSDTKATDNLPATAAEKSSADTQAATNLPEIDFASMPASVLKKMAKLKQKMETLQEQMATLLKPYRK